MSGAVMKKVAALLRDGDPMTLSELCAALKCKHASAWYACKVHPLIYIDHWKPSLASGGQWVAVYSIMDEPQDTPKPTIRPSQYVKQMEAV
jgi:hypothetical protein